MKATPLASQISSSEDFIAREALAMSVSPLQKRSKPAPEPIDATFTCTPEVARPNSSAQASAMGKTVLEPAISIVPLSAASACSSPSPPHAAATTARAVMMSPSVSQPPRPKSRRSGVVGCARSKWTSHDVVCGLTPGSYGATAAERLTGI